MNSFLETPVQKYERLNFEVEQLRISRDQVQNELNCLYQRQKDLENEVSEISNILFMKDQELNSLRDAFNSIDKSNIDQEKIILPHESDSKENNENVLRSDTPLTINTGKTKQSWASMCDSDDDGSIASNEDIEFENIKPEDNKSKEINSNIILNIPSSQENFDTNAIFNAELFKKTDMGGLFHLTTLDGKPVKHNDRSSGYQDVFKFKSARFLEKYPNAIKGMKIPVRLDTNFPNNNLIWAIFNEYKATVIRFEEKTLDCARIPWVPVLELTTLLGQKLEGTYTFGVHDNEPWYPNGKCPEYNDSFIVSLSKNPDDETNRVFYKGPYV